MQVNSTSLSPAKALLLQWFALWHAAFAFGKSMTLAQYRDPVRAAEKAEMLEVWTRFALFTLLGQIAALELQSKEDAHDIARLRVTVGALAALCLLAAKVRRQCIGLVGWIKHSAIHRCTDPYILDGGYRFAPSTLHCFALDYFDSG